MPFRPRHSLRPFARAAILSRAALVACALFALSCVASQAQQKRAAQTKRPAQAAGDKARSRRLQQQKQQAVAALIEAAESMRDYDVLMDKVSLQASAADALWPFDEQRARAILLRAWEATLAPGAGRATAEAEDAADLPGGAAEEAAVVQQSQDIVLATAVKHDARLAENFMRELARIKPEAPAEESAPAAQPGATGSLSIAGQRRHSVALSLLRQREPQSAARMAAPLVDEGATRELLAFITELRAQDAGASDALYSRLLERTRRDAGADAGDVLLLSTPVVSPALLVFVRHDGALSYQQIFYGETTSDTERSPAPLPTALRRAFFDVAASVLLRGDKASAQEGGAPAFYVAIARLLPFFEREAAHYVAALNARQAALGASLNAGLRDSLSASAKTSSFTQRNPRDPLGQTVEAIGRAADEDARNTLRLRAVEEAARRRLWERAQRFASEIGDPEMQRSARLSIAIYQVTSISEAYDNEDAEDLERAVSFVREADVPQAARAVGLIQSAHIALARGGRARALELLAEASSFAAQMPHDPTQQAVVSMLLAHAYARASDARAWEHFAGYVRALNAADLLPDPDPKLSFELRSSGRSTYMHVPAPVRPEQFYASMGRLDMTRALTEIRVLEEDFLRAQAAIAAARGVLAGEGAARVKAAAGF